MEHHAIDSSQFPRREMQSNIVYLHTGASVLAEIESRPFSGRRWIRPGTVWVMPQGSEHAVLFHNRVEGLGISFDPLRFRELLVSTNAGRGCFVDECLLAETPQLQHTMRALWHESLRPTEPGLLAAEYLATAVAHMLIHVSGPGRKPGRGTLLGLSGRQLTTILDLVRDNLSEPLSLQMMADTLGLSTFHFLRAFKRTTGCTPHQYVLEQRIEAAKDLLRQRHRTIAEVGVLVGFSHPSHFARTFRKAVGVPPHQFRRDT